MGDEVKGFQIETCFGSGGCPNRAAETDKLIERLEDRLKKGQLRAFLEKSVGGPLKHHHEFRVTVADCPNACSQPQIKDMGIIGSAEPRLTDEACTLCEACVEVCKEDAVTLDDEEEIPIIDHDLCVKCGLCIEACPTGTLALGPTGYRVMLGGKLGRHPRLAEELPGLYSEDDVVKILEVCLDLYKKKSKRGKRFAQIYWESKDQIKIPDPS
jgi:dissimilatory sulfite reductase (desulfoviridin) alpha/beta subunit